MHYPIFLNLAGQRVVVIGAGRVATRKTRSLLAAGASIAVVSPAATAAVRRLAAARRIRWIRRRYRSGDLRGARLAVAATNDEKVNRQVCADARRRNLLVNCAAPPAAGDFHVPSLVRRGGVTVAISTGGASPALAKQIRRDLEQFLGDRYAGLAKRMRALRQTAKKTSSEKERRARYRRTLRQWLKNR